MDRPSRHVTRCAAPKVLIRRRGRWIVFHVPLCVQTVDTKVTRFRVLPVNALHTVDAAVSKLDGAYDALSFGGARLLLP